jgi:hypothetical protein
MLMNMMVVALADGVGHDEGGNPFRVKAGITHVASDSLASYPGRTRRLFGRSGQRPRGPLTNERGGTSSATMPSPASVRPRRDFAAERPGVDLRLDATPRVRVVISASAMRLIADETQHVTRDHGLETGGWLFGRGTYSWDKAVEVSLATGPGARSRHAPGWCELDYDLLLQRQHVLDQAGTEVGYVGERHVHPNGLVHRSSPGDLLAWKRRWLLVDQESRLGRKRRFLPRYVGLLVEPGEGRMGWALGRLRLSAWLLQEVERGRVVCEPAAVEKQP